MSLSNASVAPPRLAEQLRARRQVAWATSPLLAGAMKTVADKFGPSLGEIIGTRAVATVATLKDVIDDAAIGASGYHLRIRYVLPAVSGEMIVAIGRHELSRLVNILFGGDGGQTADAAQQPVSAIEWACASRVLDAVADSLCCSIDDDCDSAQALERRFVEAGTPSQAGAWLCASFDVVVSDETIRLFCLLPHDVLAAMAARNVCAPSVPPSLTPAVDHSWSASLRGELAQTVVTIEAAFEEPGLTLSTLATLRIGSVLRLQSSARTPVAIMSAGQNFFHGMLGQSAGAYTIQLSGVVDDVQREESA